jgi:peptidoglycan/LPS O-acetylase OafA/YrhL
LAFILDPYDGAGSGSGANVSMSTLMLVFGLSLLLLPSPSLPHRFGETHSLNGPAWTLFQEYLANVAYGLFANRLSNRALGGVCVISAVALLLTALHFGHLGTGWAWEGFWAAFVRVTYSFGAGLLLYRLNVRLRLPHSYLWLSMLLLAVFTAPWLGRFNGVYEALCVIAVFPLAICLGADVAKMAGPLGTVCRFSGQLSYPLYIIHYPAVYVFAHWRWQTHPSNQQLWLVSTALCVGIVFVAWLLLKYFDEPIRNYLGRKLTEHSDSKHAGPLQVARSASGSRAPV